MYNTLNKQQRQVFENILNYYERSIEKCVEDILSHYSFLQNKKDNIAKIFNLIENNKIKKQKTFEGRMEHLTNLASRYQILDPKKQPSIIAEKLKLPNSVLVDELNFLKKKNRTRLIEVSHISQNLFFMYTYTMNMFFRIAVAIEFIDKSIPKGYIKEQFIYSVTNHKSNLVKFLSKALIKSRFNSYADVDNTTEGTSKDPLNNYTAFQDSISLFLDRDQYKVANSLNMVLPSIRSFMNKSGNTSVE